jgi:hypothetical protein
MERWRRLWAGESTYNTGWLMCCFSIRGPFFARCGRIWRFLFYPPPPSFDRFRVVCGLVFWCCLLLFC